ncbi:hypothetical protein CNMCM5793_009620 [Aspergillus hiratsukae]|uniref:Uncharacterized protein n=1 Tax=Aspergillus hiratsukae TaxID=1194566 RepID=A0A8H6P0K1_9EURO|nr:hypothetical protein CNMCM5793_009620 [Aspergillus hiratsukae]KAF7168697.1 hypothetical protein CNMCM6106_003815 [Aspergillus hiratsukae]
MLLEESEFKERRNKLIDHLDSIYERAYAFDNSFLDPATYDRLKIRCETLDLSDNGEYDNGIPIPNFFIPFSLETLTKHHIITLDDEDRRNYEAYEDIPDRTTARDGSQALSYRLMWHFRSFHRNGITDPRGRLMDISVWREAQFPEFIQEYFLDGVFYQRGYTPVGNAWWTAKSTPLPHLMCILEIYGFGSAEELHCGEILTILATTITRLELDDYQDEVVIPVLLFSIMSDYKGRIIQAYFNGDELVIRKSKLYDFSTRETLSSSTTLFMQWMASTPVGDTSGFALEDFVPFEEGDNTESSIKEGGETKNTACAT